MSLDQLVQSAQKYFPNLRVKYKTDSWLMKLVGKVLFFNKDFMTNYITTIGSTVYYPSQDFVQSHSNSSIIILLHELVHIKDARHLTRPLFSCLYLFPQILVLLFFPALLISWKLALLFLLLGAPLPAYFRMVFEKRAYLTSLYAIKSLSGRLDFFPMLKTQESFFIDQFTSSAYYYMWPFYGGLKKDFDQAIDKINTGQRPFEDDVFNILDELIAQI